MGRLNFKEIASPKDYASDTDQFEKFSKEFVELVLGFSVFKGPNRGADGGIDIGAIESNASPPRKWLISCKHKAYSGDSVGRGDEEDILDRTAEHGCEGFIGIYSTIASAALEQKLERLKDKKGMDFRIYASEEIERLLLSSVNGFRVAKRFFPESIQNVWPQVISLEQTYQISDAVNYDTAKWAIPQANHLERLWVYADSAEGAVNLANELAMLEIHAPMFLSAWKDAVRLYPDYFHIPAEGIEAATRVEQLAPKWESYKVIGRESPNHRWSILGVWSLVGPDAVRKILKCMGRDPSQISIDLISFQYLAHSASTSRRDILTRLFAYYIPSVMREPMMEFEEQCLDEIPADSV